MQKRSHLDAVEDANATAKDAWQEEALGGDAEFAKATREAMKTFAEGRETILLEELRAENL